MKLFEGFNVNGKPFFALGAQAHNSSSYNREMFAESIKATLAMNCNTLEAPVYWEVVEKTEGVFDFSCVDFMTEMCRKAQLKLVILWFASWKNGDISYAPGWVKENQTRFQRVLSGDGTPVSCLSSHYEENSKVDAKAFAALAAYIKKIDEKQQTIIALQVENEPGYLRTERDFSPKSLENLGTNVPEKLLSWLENHKSSAPYLIWKKEGSRKNANWTDTFGFHGYEFCEAWNLALYIDRVAAAGKKENGIPMYINVWLNDGSPWGISGIEYPGGGAVAKTLHIWLAAVEHIDLVAPDIYEQNCYRFEKIANLYKTETNALFIPESSANLSGSCNMFYAIGRGAIGYASFGIESCLDVEGNVRPQALPARDSNLAAKNAIPLIIKHRFTGKMYPVLPHTGKGDEGYEFENYIGTVNFSAVHSYDFHTRRMNLNEEQLTPRGLIFEDEPDLFYLAGLFNLRLFPKKSPGLSKIVYSLPVPDFLNIEEGIFDENGQFRVTRTRNGDEAMFGGFWVTPFCGLVRIRLAK